MSSTTSMPAPQRSISRSDYLSLMRSLLTRDLAARFRGSLLGWFWLVLTPVLMLIIFTYVFGVVFEARVPYRAADSNPIEFGVYLFSGMFIFSIFSECFTKAPTLIVSNASYVKRVVFPVDALSVVTVAAAYVIGAASFVALLLAFAIVYGRVPATAALVPFVALLMAPMLLGLSWLLSAVGAFVRDIGQFVGVALSALMFMSPIFLPIDKLPEFVRTAVMFNPVSTPVEATHILLFKEELPPAGGLFVYFVVSIAIMLIGRAVFRALQPGFADVL